MKRKVITAWLCSAIVFSFIVIMVEIAPRVEAPTTWYVDDDNIMGPWDGSSGNPYQYIQDAINVANPGDTVFVFNGTYYENVVVDKTINLTGISKENTTIDGGGSGNVVYVNVNWVNITEFTITNGRYGMLFDTSSNNTITNNNIISNKGLPAGYGIVFGPSSNNNITNNNVLKNDNGIYFSISSNIKIEGNKISSNDDTSIWFDVVSNSTIINNNISMNGGYGISLVGSSSNTITDNNASNNRIGIDLGLSSNNTIKGNNASSNNQDGIHLSSSSNNDITNNKVFSNIYKGIYLEASSNNLITDNNVSMSSLQAIYLDSSSGNNITNNNVSNNYYNGIVVHESSKNNIIGNDVYSNDNEGIIIYSSSYNEITNNDVFSNYYTGISVYSSSSNNNISHNDVHSNIKYGIYLSSSLNNNITQNNVSNHENGIFLHLSPENNVTDNMIFSNTNNGIFIGSTSDNDIVDNTISDNGRGVIISSSSNNNILGNIILNNLHSIYLYSGSSNNVINNNSLLGNLVAIYATSSTNIDARYNYFGTSYENRMEKLIYSSIEGEVDYSNWLPNRESGVQYIDGIVTWDSPITLTKGVIVNGTLTISSNVTFDNPIGQNFIHVNGTMNIDYANFTSNAGEYAIIYLNDTNGDITCSTFIGQKFVGSHREGFNIKRNKFTLGRDGLDLWKAKYNNITANNISSNRARGIYLQFSQNNSLTDNNILNNDYGIRIYQSSINNIQDNNISWCSDRGLELSISSNNTITKNMVTNNVEGIITFHSNDNTITGNNILYNDHGIRILSSSLYNRIYHNNIIKNIDQACDSNNASFWNDSYPSGGNFWSDYAGVDDYHGPDQNIPGNDGIGDSPYIYISGGSGAWDYYPLMTPFGNYTFLFNGWNLISIPSIQINTDLGVVLSSINGDYDAVRWFNATDTVDPWKHNHTQKPSHMNDLDEINHNMGIWIHVTKLDGVLFEYSGINPIVSQQIPLVKGWNLVGYPSLTSHNRTDGLNNTIFGGNITKIMWYNASTKTWHSMSETDYFRKGVGYWFYAKEDIVWHVPL